MQTGKKLTTPKAVLISDIHFGINTLDVASAALKQAITKAEELNVPLIVSGDLHDTKASLRGECVKAMIDLFKSAKVECIVIVGNHDLINEKGSTHSLEFLRPYVHLVDYWELNSNVGAYLIPYQTSQSRLQEMLQHIQGDTPKLVICHQGVNGALMGHYSQDRTSISKYEFAEFRTISGHYHTRQTILCRADGKVLKGYVGQFDYVGNPYTLNYGEATDQEKGFQVLNTDGSLTFTPTHLRKHVIVERTLETLYLPIQAGPNDLVKYKLHGVESEVVKIKKRDIGMKLLGHCNFIFEKTTTVAEKVISLPVNKRTESQLLEMLIDSKDESEEYRNYLKGLINELRAI